MRGPSTSWIELKKASAAGVLLLVLAGCEGTGVEPDAVETVAAPLSSTSVWGFVATNSATSSHEPDQFYSGNSARQAPNKVVYLARGQYRVDFPGLGWEGGGNVQVTALGTTSEKCKVGTWLAYFGTLQVYVLCFASNGAAADSLFTVTYHRRSTLPGIEGGYLAADQPSASNYTPSPALQWNSVGGDITIGHGNGPGVYYVKFPGQNFYGGTVQITALGWGSEYCKVGEWRDIGTVDQRVVVYCFNSSGQGTDTQFTAVLSKKSPNNTASYGYVLADEPTTSNYVASNASTRVYANGDRGPVSISRTGVGRYTVFFQGLNLPSKEPTSVKVTGYGPGTDSCKVASFGSRNATALVACFTPAGTPVDAKFTATFLQPFVPSFPF
jgi:hypothetical protein